MNINWPETFSSSFDSARLTIRQPLLSDAEALNAAIVASLPELVVWMPWAKSAPPIEDTRDNLSNAIRNIELRNDVRLLLFLKGTDTLVGSSGLHRPNWDIPKFEIGYWVHSAYAGKGYITEAVGAITDFAVRELAARRVEIRMDNLNESSWRVAERCNFTHEGTLRNECRDHKGNLRDTRIYAKTF